MGNNRKVTICRILSDILKLCGFGYWIFTFVIILVNLFVQLKFGLPIKPVCLYTHLIQVVPTLLGFVMTGFTILYGVQGIVLQRLSQKADDGQRPFYVISAYFSLATLSLFITLVCSLIFKLKIISDIGCESLCLFITMIFSTISVTSITNTVLHLFSMRTQFAPLKE